MNTWEFGLQTEPFAAVIRGKKTIEGRLNKGKFAEFAPGDVVEIRRDYRDSAGIAHDGESNAARVKIVAIRHYPDFSTMVRTEGFERIASYESSLTETIANYEIYYSPDDQRKYGVLAIEIEIVKKS